MTDPKVIAEGLSEAQRRAVLWCDPAGSRVHDKAAPREVSFFAIEKVIRGDPQREVALIYSLVKRGQSKTEKRGLWPAPTWRLTPLGLAVRIHLTANKDTPHDRD